MKKAIITGVTLALILFMLPSCAGGVSQAEYDKLNADLEAAQAQIESLRNLLVAKNQMLGGATARIEILNDILIPAMTGELEGMSKDESARYFLQWRDKVNAVGDPELTTKLDAIIEQPTNEGFSSLFIYLLKGTAQVINLAQGLKSEPP